MIYIKVILIIWLVFHIIGLFLRYFRDFILSEYDFIPFGKRLKKGEIRKPKFILLVLLLIVNIIFWFILP
ncbi:MAG: hypothetical protein B6229_06745 [Spirochaetaceae bacterium 4572_7]|nr:MAG: hypothetical protein B6229_06745 [Spirochaetaceae bacterium 4572_7]